MYLYKKLQILGSAGGRAKIIKVTKMANENNLVIVESPAKARTIGNMLGGNYNIMASMGHVRDLPEHVIGVDIKNNFKPEYVVSKTATIKKLLPMAESAGTIYLATDPDREGEAIAWHLKEVLAKKSKANFLRVEFHEITKSAIAKAFKNTRDIDLHLVDAQQARRVLDRLVGYQVSPMLWSRIEKNISAGRVQSVALRIICEREREILNFKPKEYWDFQSVLLHKGDANREFEAKLVFINGKKVDITNSETAEKAFNDINESKVLSVSSAKTEPVKRSAAPPFITSTMQQVAGSYLRFSASRTMQIAQQLYEGIDISGSEVVGLITYMRTDSFTISNEAQQVCRNYIKTTYGDKFVPEKPNFYKNKSSAQEAHEAIRPTDVTRTPESLASILSRDQLNLYKLIWKRFVASQMAKAEILRTTLEMETEKNGSRYTFRTTSSSILFQGFMVLNTDKNTEEQEESEKYYDFLKDVTVGDKCDIKELTKEQKFTEPPARYTEPTLIKELEANGIGRPSTYAATVNTIQQRKYVLKTGGKLVPEELGFRVNDFLVGILPDLVNIGFTAEMEEKLDEIEKGNVEWTSMLAAFYSQFEAWLNHAKYESAPDNKKVDGLILFMKKITNWEVPEKKGKRTFNDENFFNSIQKQYEKNKKLTSKQWTSLLKMLLKYYSIEDKALKDWSEKYGFNSDLNDVVKQTAEEAVKREQANIERGAQLGELKAVLQKIMACKLKSSENEGFDESKFVGSLFQQVESGRILSAKQMYVLKRIAVANKDLIADFSNISKILDISEKDVAANKEKASGSVSKEAISELLNRLGKVEKWIKNEKNPRYDDQVFYASLKKQFEVKNSLSDKQVRALEKLTEKYK